MKGFFLLESLIVLLILAVVFVSFTTVLSQALRISAKGSEITEAISRYEQWIFELENGFRPDLVRYGGQGKLDGGYQYEVRNQESRDLYSWVKTHLSWKKGHEFLNLEWIAPEGPVQ